MSAAYVLPEYEENKHRRDENGKFTFKTGGDSRSSRRSGNSAFAKAAYARADQKVREAENEKKAAESAKEAERARKQAEADAKRKQRELEAEAKRKKAEEERARRDALREASQRISPVREGVDWGNTTERVSGPRTKGVVPETIAKAMDKASEQTWPTGASNVTDAAEMVMAGDKSTWDKYAVALPVQGADKEKMLTHLKDRYSPVRIKIYDDGTGWFLDDQGILWSF